MNEEIIFAIVVTIILGPIAIWASIKSGKKWKKKEKKDTKKAG